MTEPTRSAESSPPGAAAFLWQAPTRTATGLEPPSGRIELWPILGDDRSSSGVVVDLDHLNAIAEFDSLKGTSKNW